MITPPPQAALLAAGTMCSSSLCSAGTERRGTRSLPSTMETSHSSMNEASEGDTRAPGGEKA